MTTTTTPEKTEEMTEEVADQQTSAEVPPPTEMFQTVLIDVQRWNSFRTALRASVAKLGLMVEGTADEDGPELEDGSYDKDFDESTIEDLSRIENEAHSILSIAARWRHNVWLRYQQRMKDEAEETVEEETEE